MIRLGIIAGLSPTQIAEAEHVTRQTVTRRIARLRHVEPGWPHVAAVKRAAGSGRAPVEVGDTPEDRREAAIRVLVEISTDYDVHAQHRATAARHLLDELARAKPEPRDAEGVVDLDEDEIAAALERASRGAESERERDSARDGRIVKLVDATHA